MKISAPLTKTQYGLYVECMNHGGEICYNVPFLYTFDNSLDGERLAKAIEEAVKAHPTIFTRIALGDDGEPLQVIDDSEVSGFKFQVSSCADIEVEKVKFIEPFNIVGDRLFRFRLLKDSDHYYLLQDIHHIISDGTSLLVLLADIEKAYRGEVLEPEEKSLAEVATEEAAKSTLAAFEADKKWYAEIFDCGDCYSPLLSDVLVENKQAGAEAKLTRTMDIDEAELEAFCKQHGIYKSTFFTAAYGYLLAKYNNEQQALFSTIHNGRSDKRLAHSVAMLVKTLPVYQKFTDDTTVLDFLKAGQEQMTGCRQHEAYAYSDVVNDLKLQIATMFAWHGPLFDSQELCGTPMKAVQLLNNTLEVSLYLKAFIQQGHYILEAEYASNEYSEALVGQFLESYEAVVKGMLTQTLLRDVEITTAAQTALLDSFNPQGVDYDTTETVVSLFRKQAKATPDAEAVVFKDHRYTYAQVDEISDRIAGYIAGKGLGCEDAVSVLIPRCEWMAIASMGILKAGCAYQPLDPSYPKERLNFMVKDAGARLLIADEELRDLLGEYEDDVLLTKDIEQLPAVKELPEGPKPESLFILLYTSGSTGVPKGCQLTHANLVCYCNWYWKYYDLKPEHNVAEYASYGFDVHQEGIYPPLTGGATVHIIPEELRLDLVALNEYFEREHITHTFITTQVGYQFATNIENHSLLHLSVAGEKLAPLTPPKGYKLHNGYGPTEATIIVTAFEVDQKYTDIPIGKPLENVRTYVTDSYGKRLPAGALGELWLSGPQVARGYLNRPDKQAEVFITNPFTDEAKWAPVYRTGDIVRYLPDGNIQFVGRKDGQVKIRGFRIELKEVEAVIREFPGIKDATVQAFDDEGGGKFIAAYIVADEQIDIEALNNFILDQKPPYMVPAVTMQIDSIPLNQNQKVNKKALPVPEKKAVAIEESNVPMNKLEKELHEMIAAIVNTEDFGVTTVLGYIGLTSISAIKLAVQLNRRYGITCDTQRLAKSYTLQDIENDITDFFLAGGTAGASAPDRQETAKLVKTRVPLSYAQTGVFVDCMNNPDTALYNIPMKLSLPTQVDTEQLKEAVTAIIKSHPQLSVHFENGDSETMQVTDPDQEVIIPVLAMSEEELETHQKGFVKPFNLEQGPLYRVEIVKTPQRVCLFTDFHHLVADGGSYDLFFRQLCSALAGEPVEPETLSYAVYVTSEKEASKGEEYAADKAFFDKRLDGYDGATEIIPDLSAPQEGGTIGHAYAPIDMPRIEAFCRELQVTPAHLTLAATLYTLSRFTNSEHLCITTISSGRSNLRIAGTMGMFVNTLALTSQIGSQTVEEYVRQTSNEFVETLRHENYPFAQIAADYGLVPEMMFAYQMGVIDSYMYQGSTLQVESLELNVPKFHISIYIKEYKGVPCVYLEYDNGLYSQELMQSLTNSISHVAQAFVSSPHESLTNVALTDSRDIEQLDSFNDTDRPYDDTQTVVSLFRRQAKATPDAEAVVFKDHRYTYAQVDDISDRIAGYIMSKGLGVGDAVSIIIPRCEWMVIASLGILKADCAYQPLDSSYPKERLNFMVKDADAKLLIADESLRDLVDEYQGEVLLTKELLSLPALTAEANCQLSTINCQLSPSDRFILLYTSGSTGVPKGCQLTHGNLVSYCNWYWKYYDLKPEHNVAEYASYGFDVHQEGIYPPLTGGATVHIIPEELRLDLVSLNEYLEREHITHTFMTTQVGYQFATNIENHSLMHLSVAGEKLASIAPPQGYQLHNGYGPTEATILITIYPITKKDADVPIGKPLDNVRLYVVDQQGHRLPVGAMGELWAAGPQVALGYLNRPDKNAEVFIQNPFTTEEKYIRAYRTGDIVRYLPDGNIQFVGRRDGQVKIRGFRIELKEVESVIREFPGIKDATVQAFDDEGGGKFITAYVVSDKKVDVEALNNFILDQKPPYMVPAVTMQIEAIPLNQNQKVNKKALPVPEKKAAAVGESNVPMNAMEQELHEMIAAIVGNADFGVTTLLGYVGLTSISAIKLAIQVKKYYGVTLDAKSLVKNGTLQSIENEIWNKVIHQQSAGQSDADANNYQLSIVNSQFPLSYAQTGVYFDCLKNPTSTLYNVPFCIKFQKDTDTTTLAETIKTLVKAHPQMTVHFGNGEEGIVQTVDLEKAVEIPVKQMSEAELAQYKQDFVKPFDLSTGPLYRFEIVTSEQHTYLLMDVHHLVFDGGSTDIFLQQLCSIMNGEPIEDEDQNYAAYVVAEKNAEGGADYQAAADFFKERLSVVEAATEVRPDLPNPVKGTISKAIAPLDFDTINSQLSIVNSQLSTVITPAHLVLSAIYYSLSRFANSEQVCITTVSNGRSNLNIRNTVGMFVNTLALSATIGKQTVSEFLQEVSENFDETLRHENYPFAQIVADYGLTAEIQFVYQLGMISQYVCQGSPLELDNMELQVPKFPITFFICEVQGQPSVCVEYDNGKYSARMMQRLADAVKVTVERMMANPEAALTSLCIISDEEAERIIKLGTGKEIDVDLSKTFANLFTEQAKRTPDAPAVVDRDSQLTYAEMDRYSNALAHQLIDFGVQPNDFVCVMLDRFKEFPLAVLSIHKAGAAYTPLDFEYPNERLSYMLENSESKVLITTHEVLEAKLAEGDFSTAAAKTFFIDDFMSNVPEAEPIDLSNPDGLAYMIYTSGSTGKPKGAMLHQAGLRNFIAVVIDMEKLTAEDRISGHRSFSFDAHIEDMYPVLTLGGSFHIMPTEIRKDLNDIRQFLIDHQITGGGYSTAMTSLLLNTFDDLPIRFTTGGGEKMDGVFSDHIEIINVYGPTECTDDTSYYSIAPGRRVENIPIGESVANNWNFIIDTAGNLVPQGVAGELCFAGVQVGRGYWRLPERTAKSFVDCPFVKEDRWGRPVRMYHTGDLCRWNEDGQLEYISRIDTQVKLRGFRIELGEIESKALNIEGIRQAAAEVRKVMGNEHLVLYYTLDEGSTLSEEDIQLALATSSLADYMVPDVYMKLDVMPMTPNLKINRKALPIPEMKRATEYVAPVGEKEELFCNIFSEVLKIPEVGATDNFFEIGGTSINAIKVIVEASKHDVQIVFNDLFAQKTPRALAAFVSGNETENASATEEASPVNSQLSILNYQFSDILSANTLEALHSGKRQPIGDVLLTGATGYLGIHILNELLSNYSGRILCPIRAENNVKALSRLKSLYFYYFGRTEVFNHFEERVTVFTAEVTQPDAFDSINDQLTVINCVANVKHFSAGNDIEMVNIESVRHLITFCLRTGSRLIHISTNSIAGLSVDGQPGLEVKLTEQTFNIGQNIDANKYVYSKYKAEELVLEAIEQQGLNAKIMRVGNLSARQKDGEFQINFNTNNFLATLRAYVVIGMVPYEALDQRFEFSPIDEVANAIMKLAQTPKECIVFHPNNTHRQFLSDILLGFALSGLTLRRVETEEFQQALARMMENPDLVTLLRPLMAYNVSSKHTMRWIESANEYTTQVLYRMGFQWPPTAADYVHRFVDTIVGFDYFTV
jgi:amino acid adenylation domain-containing protein